MATNKERIKNLEASLGGLQENLSRMELGVNDKLHQLEAAISKISEAVLAKQDPTISYVHERSGQSSNGRAREHTEGGCPMFSSKLAKLEFPKYSGEDPTEWLTRVEQFFGYQGTMESQTVSLASFHLEREANQWWQWLRRAYQEEEKEVTWSTFVEELWSRFGPTDCEDFDESLSKIRQTGSLRDYQKEFERLGNRVRGWTQKALVGTFMGGLKPEVADGIWMFKPKSLKEAISLARMRDEQLSRQKKITHPFNMTNSGSCQDDLKPASPVKQLSWEEMQRRRLQGLCFNCDEKFTPGHKCKVSQLLLLEGIQDEEEVERNESEFSLYTLTGCKNSKKYSSI